MVEPRAGVLGQVLEADADLAGALGCCFLHGQLCFHVVNESSEKQKVG